MSDNVILSPWRDGTPEGELSADLFDEVVNALQHDAPESTALIKASGYDAIGYIASVLGDDYEMQSIHRAYLLLALKDQATLDLVDALAARVRLICDPIRQMVAV